LSDEAENVDDAAHQRGFLTKYGSKRIISNVEVIV